MPEERRCDLCKFEKDLPCADKGCNIVNGHPCFEPKGEEMEQHGPGCESCYHWASVNIGEFCPDCGQQLIQ